jgi:hypothetical protein
MGLAQRGFTKNEDKIIPQRQNSSIIQSKNSRNSTNFWYAIAYTKRNTLVSFPQCTKYKYT